VSQPVAMHADRSNSIRFWTTSSYINKHPVMSPTVGDVHVGRFC